MHSRQLVDNRQTFQSLLQYHTPTPRTLAGTAPSDSPSFTMPFNAHLTTRCTLRTISAKICRHQTHETRKTPARFWPKYQMTEYGTVPLSVGLGSFVPLWQSTQPSESSVLRTRYGTAHELQRHFEPKRIHNINESSTLATANWLTVSSQPVTSHPDFLPEQINKKSNATSRMHYNTGMIRNCRHRWQYCVECPQYSTRLEALGYLCDCVSRRVQR